MRTDVALSELLASEDHVSPRVTNQHPSSHYLAAAFAFLFDQADNFLLLRERGQAKYPWDLPGGTLTDQETPVDGLKREVMEETGLAIRLISPLCWLKWDWHDSGQPILVAFYVAEVADGEVSLSEEHGSFCWVSIDKFNERHLELSAEPDIVRAVFEHYRERCGR